MRQSTGSCTATERRTCCSYVLCIPGWLLRQSCPAETPAVWRFGLEWASESPWAAVGCPDTTGEGGWSVHLLQVSYRHCQHKSHLSLTDESFWSLVTFVKYTEELHNRRAGDVRDPPCDSKGLVGYFRPTVRNRELVFTEQCVTLPSKDGVITKTAEDGVTERKEKDLQQTTVNHQQNERSKFLFDNTFTLRSWISQSTILLVLCWAGMSACLPSVCQQTALCSASSSSGSCPGPRAGLCLRMWWWHSGLSCGQRWMRLLLRDLASSWPAALCLCKGTKCKWNWMCLFIVICGDEWYTEVNATGSRLLCTSYPCQSTWWYSQSGPQGTLRSCGGWKPEQCRPVQSSAPDEICLKKGEIKKTWHQINMKTCTNSPGHCEIFVKSLQANVARYFCIFLTMNALRGDR